MPDLTTADWIVFLLTGLMVGLAKTGLPGIAIVAVLLLAGTSPGAQQSVGIMLPLLIVGDVFAVAYYRRHAVWRHLVKLIPFALVGVVIGYGLHHVIPEGPALKLIIGVLVLVMLGLNHWRIARAGPEAKIPSGWLFAGAMGLAAGVATTLANAAGPIMIIYLLAMRLPRYAFIGTSAWYFMIVNWIKVPFFVDLGLITVETLRINLLTVPCIAVGALVGIWALKRIPERPFRIVVELLAWAAAIKLVVSAWGALAAPAATQPTTAPTAATAPAPPRRAGRVDLRPPGSYDPPNSPEHAVPHAPGRILGRASLPARSRSCVADRYQSRSLCV